MKKPPNYPATLSPEYEKLRAELIKQAEQYKPRNRPWTADENRLVKEFYLKVPLPELAKRVGRTMKAVQQQAESLRKS